MGVSSNPGKFINNSKTETGDQKDDLKSTSQILVFVSCYA